MRSGHRSEKSALRQGPPRSSSWAFSNSRKTASDKTSWNRNSPLGVGTGPRPSGKWLIHVALSASSLSAPPAIVQRQTDGGLSCLVSGGFRPRFLAIADILPLLPRPLRMRPARGLEQRGYFGWVGDFGRHDAHERKDSGRRGRAASFPGQSSLAGPAMCLIQRSSCRGIGDLGRHYTHERSDSRPDRLFGHCSLLRSKNGEGEFAFESFT